MSTFEGFSPDGLRVLKDLARHNDRAWFQAKKDVFERGVVEPGKLFVSALGARLATLDDAVQAVPKIGGSLFRQHRDTRFAKDKSPFKTHFDMLFWTGDKKGGASSAFMVRLTGEELWIGVGVFELEKDALARVRAAIDDDDTGPALADLVHRLEKAGAQIGEEGTKRVPRPYPADHPRGALLKRKGLTAMQRMPLPPEATSAKLVDLVFRVHTGLAPLHLWINAATTTAKRRARA